MNNEIKDLTDELKLIKEKQLVNEGTIQSLMIQNTTRVSLPHVIKQQKPKEFLLKDPIKWQNLTVTLQKYQISEGRSEKIQDYYEITTYSFPSNVFIQDLGKKLILKTHSGKYDEILLSFPKCNMRKYIISKLTNKEYGAYFTSYELGKEGSREKIIRGKKYYFTNKSAPVQYLKFHGGHKLQIEVIYDKEYYGLHLLQATKVQKIIGMNMIQEVIELLGLGN